MKYYLYKYEANWADEMDVAGFAVLTETEKDMALAKIKKDFRRGGTVCIGSNEEIEYGDIDEVMNDVSIEEISKQDYDVIIKIFGKSFGENGPCDNFFYFEDFFEEDKMDEEEDEEEDEEIGYEENADKVVSFIKKEFNLEENDSRSDCYSSFLWKPTPKTQIDITIPYEEDEGGGEIEVALKLNGRELDIEFFDVEITSNSTYRLEDFIKKCVQKANKF